MHIESLVLGPLETNCHIAWNDPGQAIVIDPGADSDAIMGFLDRRRLKVAAWMATHGHFDHISALSAVHGQQPAPIGMSRADERWAFNPSNSLPPLCSAPSRPSEIARQLEDGQEWNDIGTPCRIIATPGHSPGGVCFYFPQEAVLFSGDTLFRGSIGRTDLPGSNSDMMVESLARLAALPPKTRVFPGHGPDTTIEAELRTNPFFTSISTSIEDRKP
jgi:hydroxyacylglutathione hydrolase